MSKINELNKRETAKLFLLLTMSFVIGMLSMAVMQKIADLANQ